MWYRPLLPLYSQLLNKRKNVLLCVPQTFGKQRVHFSRLGRLFYLFLWLLLNLCIGLFFAVGSDLLVRVGVPHSLTGFRKRSVCLRSYTNLCLLKLQSVHVV